MTIFFCVCVLEQMASKSALKLSAIQDFYGRDYLRASRRGENALEAGHLLNFKFDGELNHISAVVHASQRNTRYNVTVSICQVLDTLSHLKIYSHCLFMNRLISQELK